MNDLGVMYYHGKGVEKSYEKAKEYYEPAAHLGCAQAQFNLGCLYANGVGVEQDLTKASGLTAKAAAQKDMMVPFYALQFAQKEEKVKKKKNKNRRKSKHITHIYNYETSHVHVYQIKLFITKYIIISSLSPTL
jgi:TPR repeat protein